MARVVITEPAEYDLLDIEYYIRVHLCNPSAAERMIDGILEMLWGLAQFPERYHYVNDDLLRKLSLRMTWFDNYNIFYYYDENADEVHIIRILYNRADWQHILKR
ncbi:MAG: type II toxin-antitoxin system RelE/ParE family toxin [Clostridium sp.]|nr:type II toxin-antitoxin system RelE/ParE family toxin [Clostridium sp.]